jgi:hypothetical protein
MGKDRRAADELSWELEALLARKKLEARQEARAEVPAPGAGGAAGASSSRTGGWRLPGRGARPDRPGPSRSSSCPRPAPRPQPAAGGSGSVPVLGLTYLLVSGFGALRSLNQEVAGPAADWRLRPPA